jgi:3-oxoacyl-(acyl-carrier-protein) synthase
VIYMTHCVTASTTESTVYEDIAYPQRVHIFPETYSRIKSGMSYPPHVMFNKVITSEVVEYVKNNPVKGKTAFLFAAGSQGWSGIGGRYDKNPDAELHYKTKIPFITLTNIYAGRIASMFGVEDYVATDATACASSLKVLMDMQNLISQYGFDRVIVLSGEDSVSIHSLEFFGDANACLLLDDEDKRKPSAFDSVNYGFHVGQGAALTIFEVEHAGMATPIARFLGAYTASENSTNPLGQREDGAGYVKAIEGALLVARLDASVVKLVKTHGTGTPVNNVAEKTALTNTLSEFIATSYKQRIGHTLSASGLLETGLLFEDIARGSIPAIPNRTEHDPVFISNDCPAPKGVVLSLAAGMGNVYSAALFSAEV